MNWAQSAGMMVTIIVIATVDMRVDWLVPLAMLSGGVAIYFVSMWERLRR